MRPSLFLLLLPFAIACDPAVTDDDDSVAGDDDDTCDIDAPTTLDGASVRIVEPANAVDNTWDFGPTDATMQGAGVIAPYTYSASGCTSTLVLTVGGADTYEMLWTSTTGGTCTESFDGSSPVDCTFNVL